ncbi:MAG: hypothetical protein U1F52_20455 [Burkholderiales bacterium]
MTLVAGERISEDEARGLAALLRLGALRLPCVVSSAVVLKVAAVSGGSWRVTMATGIGRLVNGAGNLWRAPSQGPTGIAIASVAGSAVSALAMLLLTRKRAQLPASAVLLVCGTWGGLGVLGLAIGTQSLVVGTVAVILLALLGRLHWIGIVGREQTVPG